MVFVLNRRSAITSAAAFSCFPVHTALGNPIIGLFARMAFSEYAKSAAARVLATSAAQAVARPLARSALSGVSRLGMKNAEAMMVAGGFSSLVTDFAGRLAGDIAADAVLSGGTDELAIVHSENPENDGYYGMAQCLGVVGAKGSNRDAIMLESPEIVALEELQQTVISRGFSGAESARILVPLQMVNNGNFNYATGHDTPAVFDTHEGRVALLSHANGDAGYVEGKFFPKAGSSYDEFSARYNF